MGSAHGDQHLVRRCLNAVALAQLIHQGLAQRRDPGRWRIARLVFLCRRKKRLLDGFGGLEERLAAVEGMHRLARGAQPDAPSTLHGDPAVGAVVLDRDLRPRLDRQFLRREKFLAGHFAVDDPAIGVAFARAAGEIGSR